MQKEEFSPLLLFILLLGPMIQTGLAQHAPDASSKSIPAAFAPLFEARKALAIGGSIPMRHSVLRSSSSSAQLDVSAAGTEDFGDKLPLWTFDAQSPRDGQRHVGVMVGTNPFDDPGTTKVPTHIIPLILKMHSVAVSYDATTGIITTQPGNVTFDPTQPDRSCLSTPNNVPVTLLSQSPIFNPASFSFGPTFVGNTQYIDAFQRGNFYGVLGSNLANYHLLLDPVDTLQAVEIDLDPALGIAITDPNFFGPPAFCAPLGIVDFYWLDFYLNDSVLPALHHHNVNPGTLPIFMIYNTFEGGPANNLFTCCILGYHSFGGFPIPAQTYSLLDFDTTGTFGPQLENTLVAAHEVGEWANDPYGINLVPPWGGTGQVAGCQSNLEVGDPLTPTNIPPVTMPNGFTYNLQELAFFSWFFGGKSIGANGWYSNNGTFLSDAGPPCLYE